MMKMNLMQTMEKFEELSGHKIKPEEDAEQLHSWFKDWLEDSQEEIELDDMAELMLIDYQDFSDYIFHLQVTHEPRCICDIGCFRCLGMSREDFF